MATLTAGEAKQVAPRGRAAAQQAEVAAPSRREFLYYVWGASIALLLGEAGAAFIWFALPRFKEGTFGGTFTLSTEKLPTQPDIAPVSIPEGRFHISLTDRGLVALYGVCTHLGCLPKWSSVNHRFECPCHGSKYEIDGTYIEGPAPRGLDRFFTTINFVDGTQAEMGSDGSPIPLDGKSILNIQVNTGRRIMGPRHA